MKNNLILTIAGILFMTGIVLPVATFSQSNKSIVKKYMQELQSGSPENDGRLQKYRMTAVYVNRDLYGNFTGKTIITGDYTRGAKDGTVVWNNVLIAESNKDSNPFPSGIKQEYMENFSYTPSMDMLKKEAFASFPANPESVFARNLVWDMKMIEQFAWQYSDSLKLNKEYRLIDHQKKFEMADIGNYQHASIWLTWTGISFINNELCAVIEYRAVDNVVGIEMDQISTKGTEEYWGTTWVSLNTRQIEYAETYSGTFQEIAVKGLKDKFLAKTIREIKVERIK
jgi:hypothetical protein